MPVKLNVRRGEMVSTYLIRYGLMGHVGHFRTAAEADVEFRRGEAVVIRSPRGVEIGEVLTACDDLDPADDSRGVGIQEGNDAGHPRVYRTVGSEDLAQARAATEARVSRFAMCERILKEAGRDWELIDIEPLLDGGSIVLHYFGPDDDDLEAAALRARFRVASDVDVIFEPVGIGEPRDSPAGEEQGEHGCGRCGAPAGDSQAESAGGGCGSFGSTAGCSSCALSRHVAGRRR